MTEQVSADQIDICHVGDPIIRASSIETNDIVEARRVVDLLTTKLDQLRGAGLAAPQIGIPLRIFVIQIRKTELFPDREETPLHVMINPHMEVTPCAMLEEWEGCFSVPGFAGKVPRYSSVQLSWTDYEGTVQERRFDGYLARVVQHEYDHLEGKVYLDRMPDMRCFYTTENYVRRRKAGTL